MGWEDEAAAASQRQNLRRASIALALLVVGVVISAAAITSAEIGQLPLMIYFFALAFYTVAGTRQADPMILVILIACCLGAGLVIGYVGFISTTGFWFLTTGSFLAGSGLALSRLPLE